MGFVSRKSASIGKGRRVNLSKRGVSVSQRVGRLTVNTRGTRFIRILARLSFRFGKQR
jgi:hypothetical protein